MCCHMHVITKVSSPDNKYPCLMGNMFSIDVVPCCQQVPHVLREGVHTSTAREIFEISVPAKHFKAVVLHLFIKFFAFMPDT